MKSLWVKIESVAWTTEKSFRQSGGFRRWFVSENFGKMSFEFKRESFVNQFQQFDNSLWSAVINHVGLKELFANQIFKLN